MNDWLQGIPDTIKNVSFNEKIWYYHYLLHLLTSFLSHLLPFPFAVCFSSHLVDPAVDDFVLMHCVFMPNTQLCPLLMAQYPFCLYFPVFSLQFILNSIHSFIVTSCNPDWKGLFYCVGCVQLLVFYPCCDDEVWPWEGSTWVLLLSSI